MKVKVTPCQTAEPIPCRPSPVHSVTPQLITAVQRLCGLQQLLAFWALPFPSVKWGWHCQQHHRVVRIPSCYKWTAWAHIWHIVSTITIEQPPKTETQTGHHYFLASTVFCRRDICVFGEGRRWLPYPWEIQLWRGRETRRKLCAGCLL